MARTPKKSVIPVTALDTHYFTVQRDMIISGLSAEIGSDAFHVYLSIKAHADYQNGRAWPSMRRLTDLTGLSLPSVHKAVKSLEEHHLLRVSLEGRKNIYIARERLVVRVGALLVCTVVADYIPLKLRDALEATKSTLAGYPQEADDAVRVEIIPGPGFAWDATAGALKQDVPPGVIAPEISREAIQANIALLKNAAEGCG